MMTIRSRHLATQLWAALRASRWNAGAIARRAYMALRTMARALVGYPTQSLDSHMQVAEQLNLRLELIPWKATGSQPPDADGVATVLDRTRRRAKTRSRNSIAGILRPPQGVGPVSIEDMRR